MDMNADPPVKTLKKVAVWAISAQGDAIGVGSPEI